MSIVNVRISRELISIVRDQATTAFSFFIFANVLTRVGSLTAWKSFRINVPGFALSFNLPKDKVSEQQFRSFDSLMLRELRAQISLNS